MKKVFGVASLALALLVMGAVAVERPPRVYRVGVLLVGSADFPTLRGLREGLEEAGYSEGKNLVLDLAIKNSYDELPQVARTFRDKRTDVIVAIGDTTTGIARDATREIPVVFIHGIDPLGLGFVKSLARPGTNITGLVSYLGYDMQAKRLEVLKDLVPGLRRVAVLYNARPDAAHHAQNLEAVRKIAPHLGLRLVEKPVKTVSESKSALSSVSKENADGIFIICSGLFRIAFKEIAAAARKKKLPLNGCDLMQVTEQGGLWTYAPDTYRLGYRGASYVDRILKGARPQNLPVETPAKFELVINLKTADEIGLTIPPEVLMRADKVIH